jgi:putative FmdB family regulatory protein
MPIYEYSCGKCGAHLEVMQKISDKPLARHERCGGKLTKEWSQTSFQLKGSGWYVTDYAGRKADAKDTKDGKESKAESSQPQTTETKAAESKPSESKAVKEPKAAKAAAGGD